MRAGIIGAMLASQDWLDSQRNCFELYGADFLLSEGDLRPWLLEVNCSPCMAPSTSVTARMCAQCLEDVLRGEFKLERCYIEKVWGMIFNILDWLKVVEYSFLKFSFIKKYIAIKCLSLVVFSFAFNNVYKQIHAIARKHAWKKVSSLDLLL